MKSDEVASGLESILRFILLVFSSTTSKNYQNKYLIFIIKLISGL